MIPRALCEFPAGLAALSLYIHGGPKCRPPISRTGNKAGYAEAIAGALDLRPGGGAGAYVWAEADLDVAALLRTYPDAAMLRRVAEIIRGWADEEPRALWERLRAERKARGARADETGTAAWIVEGQWSYQRGTIGSGFNSGITQPTEWRDRNGNVGTRPATTAASMADACHRLAEYATIQSMNRLVCMADDGTGALMNTGNGGTRFGGEFATPPGEVAERFEGMAREVAGYTIAEAWGATGQWCGPDRGGASGSHPPGWVGSVTIGGLVRRYESAATGWPPVAVLTRIPEPAEVAEWLGTPGDLEGVVVYSDPPYVGTTGYRHDLPREAVVRMALGFAAMGATVCISEAEPLFELDGPEWHVCEITGGRKGQKRTFSAQKREFLTMNRAPAHRVAEQVGLFGAA